MDSQNTNVRTLFILWGAFFIANFLYAMLAYFLTQGRTQHPEQAAHLHDPLAGVFAVVPLVLPLLLLAIGSWLWKQARAGTLRSERQGLSELARTRVALILLVAVSESNTLFGMLFFFLGTPLIKFGAFVLGTACLMLIALQKLFAATIGK